MSLATTLDVMLAAGASAEMIVAVVKADIAEREAKDSVRREKDAFRSAERRRVLPDDWENIRVIVFNRDNWTCCYCKAKPVNLHCDHVIPISKGGDSSLDNLVTSCGPCNSSKRDKFLEEWIGRINA